MAPHSFRSSAARVAPEALDACGDAIIPRRTTAFPSAMPGGITPWGPLESAAAKSGLAIAQVRDFLAPWGVFSRVHLRHNTGEHREIPVTGDMLAEDQRVIRTAEHAGPLVGRAVNP
jgi:hypothetical protein